MFVNYFSTFGFHLLSLNMFSLKTHFLNKELVAAIIESHAMTKGLDLASTILFFLNS